MNQPTNQNFQEDVAPVRREMTLEIVKEFMGKVGTELSSDQFDEALKIIKILDGLEGDKNIGHVEKLSKIIWAGVVDASDEDEKASRQKVYDDYPWLSHGITTNDSRLTSAPL